MADRPECDELAVATAPAGDEPPAPDRARFHWIRSPLYRTVHASGVHGGAVPSGTGLHMALFHERGGIPHQTVNAVSDAGLVMDEIVSERVPEFPTVSEGEPAITREVEVGIYLDWSAAEVLHRWLGQWVEKHREITEAMRGEQ